MIILTNIIKSILCVHVCPNRPIDLTTSISYNCFSYFKFEQLSIIYFVIFLSIIHVIFGTYDFLELFAGNFFSMKLISNILNCYFYPINYALNFIITLSLCIGSLNACIFQFNSVLKDKHAILNDKHTMLLNSFSVKRMHDTDYSFKVFHSIQMALLCQLCAIICSCMLLLIFALPQFNFMPVKFASSTSLIKTYTKQTS